MIKFKLYSTKLSKYDLISILVPRAISSAASSILTRNPAVFFKEFFLHGTADIFSHLAISKIHDIKNQRLGNLTNKDLIAILVKYGYKEGRDYTIGNKKSPITLNLNNGILMVSMEKGWNEDIVKFLQKFNSQLTDMGKFTFISYQSLGRSELDKVVDQLMRYAKKVNIYDN